MGATNGTEDLMFKDVKNTLLELEYLQRVKSFCK